MPFGFVYSPAVHASFHAEAWMTLNLEQDVYNYKKKLELNHHVQVTTYVTSGLRLDLRNEAWLT
jgi:hypothetical protein